MGEPFLLTKHFYNTVERRSHADALMEKVNGAYQAITYQQMKEKVEQVSSFLVAQGFELQSKIALISENRPEWPIADMGILSAGLVNVPLYPTLTGRQISYILNNSDSQGLIISNQMHLDKIAEVFEELEQIKFVAVIDEFEYVDLGDNIRLISFARLLQEGQEQLEDTRELRAERLNNLSEEDVASIVYTSGTTGNPKGVMLTHKNLASNARAAVGVLTVPDSGITLSFLPLSHVLERIVNYAFQLKGATIAYAENFDTIAQNLQEVQPHTFAAVPRVFEKIYNKIIASVESGSAAKKKIFYWALEVGRERIPYILEGRPIPALLKLKCEIAHKLVFKKIHERTGGRIIFALSGGAPLMKEIAEFFFAAGIPLLEGYGLTETSPVICINRQSAARLGTVGQPIPDVEVKIAEDGEILARGPNIMKGYYKNPEATDDVLEADGWFHTGDIGVLDKDNFLKITDRKKEILVMSNGKNVAPQPIENKLKTSQMIEQAVVLGDNKKYIAALIYPNYEALEHYMKENGLSIHSRTDMADNSEVKQFLRKEIDRVTEEFARYEQIKKFTILTEELTQEAGLLTPTLKYKRRMINETYQKEIAALFEVEATVK